MKYLVMVILFIVGSVAMSQSIQVSKKTWTDGDWPLTVSKGTLHCENDCAWFQSGGKKYALNGTAKTRYRGQKGWVDIQKIWKNDPDIQGAKISIGPMLEKARSLCK